MRGRMMLLAMLSSGIGLALVYTEFFIFDFRDFCVRKGRDLETTAHLLSADASAALAFDDADRARQMLSALRAQQSIRAAVLYRRDGTSLAEYLRQDVARKFRRPRLAHLGAKWKKDSLSFAEQVCIEEKCAGTLYLEADLADVRSRLFHFAWVTVVMGVICLLLVRLLSKRLSRSIVRPIYDLAWTARLVAGTKNFSLRAPILAGHEIGQLAADFNKMLDEIEQRDSALREAQDSLETRVAERTTELEDEVRQRRRAEEDLRERTAFLDTLISTNPLAIVVESLQGEILMTNPAFRELFGYEKDEVLGKSLDDLVAPGELRRDANEITNGVNSGKHFHARLQRRRKDGRLVDVEVYGVPLVVDGVVRGQFGIYEDITQQVAAEVKLREAKEAAEAASRAKSEFLANMSHEIRTPMNGILGMTELALDTNLNAEQRECLAVVKSSADALLSILNDILDFSKIEAGKIEIERVPFRLRDCIEEALRLLALRAGQKGLELEWEVDPKVPDSLVGDPTRLRQVILNLVGNAIKFTRQGGVTVRAELGGELSDSVPVRISVTDTGIGIPLAKRDKIFEAFAQADSSTTREFGGTGLGLSIAARLVRLMGGTIDLESELGKGSRFWFLVSLGRAEEGATQARPALAECLKDKRVLCVDDSEPNRRFLESLLGSWGMEPSLAADGATALRDFRLARGLARPFDACLLDLQMPGMDGLQLAAQLRELDKEGLSQLLLLTSVADPCDEEKRQRLGIRAILLKPIHRETLRKALISALEETRPETAPRARRGLAVKTLRLRVLLCEDNLVNQKLAAGIFKRLGHSVDITNNGREALDRIAQNPYDIVIMDLQMPVMGGLEATQLLRERESVTGGHLPVVAMTAHALKGDREKCLEAGMDGYVSKPIRVDLLEEEVRRAMETFMPDSKTSALPSKRSEPTIDSAELLQRVDGDRELLWELIAAMREDLPKQLQLIKESLSTASADGLQRAGHTLKGAFANLAAHSARDLAARLEAMGRAGELSEAGLVFNQLQSELHRVSAALERLCREVPVEDSGRG